PLPAGSASSALPAPPAPPASASSEAPPASSPPPALPPPPPAPRTWAPPPAFRYPPPGWIPEARPKPEVVWYGWQIIIPAIISDTLVTIGGLAFLVGRGSSQEAGGAVLLAGTVAHVLIPPIIHLGNSQPGKAGLSFVLE